MAVLPLEFFDSMNEARVHYPMWNKQDKLCIVSLIFGISKNRIHRSREYVDTYRIWGWGKWDTGQRIQTSRYKFWGLMYSVVAVVSSVELLKIAEKIDLKCSHHNNNKMIFCEMKDVLIILSWQPLLNIYLY